LFFLPALYRRLCYKPRTDLAMSSILDWGMCQTQTSYKFLDGGGEIDPMKLFRPIWFSQLEEPTPQGCPDLITGNEEINWGFQIDGVVVSRGRGDCFEWRTRLGMAAFLVTLDGAPTMTATGGVAAITHHGDFCTRRGAQRRQRGGAFYAFGAVIVDGRT